MADEIQLNISVNVSKDPISVAKSVSSVQTMAGDDYLQATQIIPTSWTALALGAVTAPPGTILIKNLDETNFVQFALANDDTGIFCKLKPLSIALFEPTDTTLFLKADTATVKVEVLLLEA